METVKSTKPKLYIVIKNRILNMEKKKLYN